MDQHPSGRADLYDYISANNICNNVDNTNVPNDIIENNDVIASIEPHLKFWPNNEDPWGELKYSQGFELKSLREKEKKN